MSINYNTDRICASFEDNEYTLAYTESVDITGWFFDHPRECMYDISSFKGFDTPEQAIQDALSRSIKVYKLSETEITM